MNTKPFHIAPALSSDDLRAVKALFSAYAASLGIDLEYQNFAAEMAAMPGKYARPSGALLLARDAAGHELGCVGLRRIDGDAVCEMKRLYVAPVGRGLGVGRALVEAAISEATKIGYSQIWLDTLPSMRDAQKLYGKLGFAAIAPYYATPVAGTVFLARSLV